MNGSLFRDTDRQRLVMEILTDHIEEKQFGISQGSGLDFGNLLRAKIIKDVYVLHNVDQRNELLSRWGQKTCCICCQKKNPNHEFDR